MEIKKTDRPVSVSSEQNSEKSEPSNGKKLGASKGIAESESKFETLKPTSLFQDSPYSSARSANAVPKAGSENRNVSSRTNSITDGTSNTIVLGESTPAQDQQAGTPVNGRGRGDDNRGQQGTTTTITDGTSNTIVVGETTEPSAQDQSNSTTITDGTSNTIVVGEQTESTETSTQCGTEDQRPEESQSSTSTTNTTDGTSNTIFFSEEEPAN